MRKARDSFDRSMFWPEWVSATDRKARQIMTSETLISVDSPESWPKSLRDAISDLDARVPPASYATDLELSQQDLASVRVALGSNSVRARHFTRLLPHEFDWIRAAGLRLFSRELFDERIDAAMDHGYFGPATADVLKRSSIPAAEAGKRGDRDFVCLTIGPVAEESPGAVERLIGTWGGEGIYFATGAKPYLSLLRALGRPTAVVARVSPVGRSALRFWPPVEQLMLGRFRNLPDSFGDVFSREAIPAGDIVCFEMLD